MNDHRKIIYLDQNAWINISDNPDLRDLYSRLKAATEANEAIVPLSFGNLIETMRTPDRSRRAFLATRMMELSKGYTIAPEYYLVPFELDYAIAHVFGMPAPPLPNPLGSGVNFAFGYLHVSPDRLGAPPYQVDLVRRILDSPEGMHALLVGPPFPYNDKVSENFLGGAKEFAKEADKARELIKPYSSAVRKRGYAAVLANILDSEIRQSLAKFGITYDQLLALGRKKLIALFSDIPCLDVEIEIGSQRNGFWNRPVDPNDLVDISSLCVAIPYCDAVVTEGFWVDLACRAKLNGKYSTHITKDPASLIRVL